MTRTILSLLAALVAMVSLLWPSDASAVPVFARKYGFVCSMCHSAYPRLNDFGVRFRADGYHLPGKEREEATVLQTTAPFAARTTVGYVYEKNQTDRTPARNDITVESLDLFSGGVLGPRAGYIFVFPPRLAASSFVSEQPGTVELANVEFELVPRGVLGLRAGRLETAATVFSNLRRLTLSPYEVYGMTFPGGVALSDVQNGIELSSTPRGPFRGAAGWVSGSATNRTIDTQADAYARLAWVLGPGEGNSAGQRIGVFGYAGRARPNLIVNLDQRRRTFYRAGADLSLNLSQVNLSVLGMIEKDAKELWGLSSKPTLRGGFAELTWTPATALALVGRVDLVGFPREVRANSRLQNASRWTAAARCYVEPNLAVHAEYSRRDENTAPARTPKLKTNFAALALDLAF